MPVKSVVTDVPVKSVTLCSDILVWCISHSVPRSPPSPLAPVHEPRARQAVRLSCRSKATKWGYSAWELEVMSRPLYQDITSPI